jgi:hypothetical protein
MSAEKTAQQYTAAVAATKDLDPAAQESALAGFFATPGEKTSGVVSIIVVGGLVFAVLLALGGLIYLLAEGKETDVVLTAFTAILAGLLGLFSPSPAKGKSN